VIAMPTNTFSDLWDLLTDGFKLIKGNKAIKQAFSEAVDAANVAGQSAEIAARDASAAMAKLKVFKDLIVKATD
jgi:hypothetical protein